MLKKHVVLLKGGSSKEAAVSHMSGDNVLSALKRLRYKVTVITSLVDLPKKLLKAKPDVVFNALHGTYGEDGAIPGLLELMQIPYTHSGINASSIAINKQKTKDILHSYGVRSPKSVISDITTVQHSLHVGNELLERPYVIKPLNQGSSLGVYIVNQDREIDLSDWCYGNEVMLEEYIPGIELAVAVLGNKAMNAVLELDIKNSEFFDYKAKYTQNIINHIIPAKINAYIHKEILHFSEIAHKVLNCRTISRSDFKYDNTKGKNGLYFLEINTHPGMTELSMVPEIAKYLGISLEEIIEKLVIDARCDIST